MKNDYPEIKVMFLLEKDSDNEVFAFFPTVMHSIGNNECFSLTDGHAPCTKEYAKECEFASPNQYKDIKSSLELNYDLHNLKVLKSW